MKLPTCYFSKLSIPHAGEIGFRTQEVVVAIHIRHLVPQTKNKIGLLLTYICDYLTIRLRASLSSTITS